MTIEDLTARIETTREQLHEVELERGRLGPDHLGEKAKLLEETQTLQARLAQLEESAARLRLGTADERATTQTDLTRAPRLPQP